jgi:transposase
MTCATCARTARPVLIARVSAGSQTRSIPSGSPERCSLTRCCPRRSSAPGRSRARTSSTSCSRCGNNRRRSILTSRQHLVNEAEYLLCELPLELSEQLPDTKAVKPRLAALARRNRRRRYDAPTMLRLQLLDGYRTQIKALDLEEKQVVAQLDALVRRSGSTLDELSGLSTWLVAELLVEVGDPRRFTEGGFARFNGSAPLPASTAEGPGEPVRHRYNPGGNRRVNAILHRMAVTQLRREPRAQRIYANARAGGHTKKEARRVLKRHLSNVIYRRMIRDAHAQLPPDQSLLAA